MSRELKLRIVFGILYAATVVGLLFTGKIGAYILLSLFGLAMLWEYNNVISKSSSEKPGSTFTIIIVNAVLVGLAYYFIHFGSLFWVFLALSLAYSVLNAIWLLTKGTTIANFKPGWLHGFFYLTLPISLALLMVKFRI